MAYVPISKLPEPVHLGEFLRGDNRFPAIYFLYHRGEVVYVGQSRTLKLRIDQHIAQGAKQFDSVAFIPCSVNHLTATEARYIRELTPKYNSCGLSKKLRERVSWSREQNVEGARRRDAFDRHIDEAADCGVIDEDGECFIRPSEFGKFLMISDKDAADLLPLTEKVSLIHMLKFVCGNRDLHEAQRKFESLI